MYNPLYSTHPPMCMPFMSLLSVPLYSVKVFCLGVNAFPAFIASSAYAMPSRKHIASEHMKKAGQH